MRCPREDGGARCGHLGGQVFRPAGLASDRSQEREDTHRKKVAAALVVALAVAAWVPASRAADYPADNSGKNVRDRQDNARTPGDQSNSKSDIAITQEVRKAVVADKALSTNAHNVKIITKNGVVTLRGPVKSQEEKDTIAAKAKHVAGVKNVDNQLEIASR
jgi:hyperosmotically inducible protein